MGKILQKQQKNSQAEGIHVEQNVQVQQTLQYRKDAPGIVEDAYEISRQREEQEQEVAAHPNVFKKGYQRGQNAKLKELRKKDSIGDMVHTMVTDFEEQLDEKKTKNPEQVGNVFGSCMKKHAPADVFRPEQLLLDQVERPKEFTALCEILSDLQKTSAGLFSRKSARMQMQKYLSLELPWGEASSAHYLREKNQNDSFWGAKLLEHDPSSCYVILYQCAAVALRNSLNYVDRSQVNLSMFSILCGISMTATQAASAICISDEFEERRQRAEEEILAEQKVEEAKKEGERTQARQEQAEQTRLLNLQELISHHHGRKEWFADQYEPCLKKALHAMLEKQVSGADSDAYTTEMQREAERVMEHLSADLASIESYFNTHPDLYLGMPRLKDKLCAAIAGKLDMEQIGQQVRKVLNGDAPQDADGVEGLAEKTIEAMIQADPQHMDVSTYRERRDACLKKMPFLQSDHEKELWKNASLQDLVFDEGNEETFEERLSEAVEQATVNEVYLQRCVEQKLLKCSQALALEKLRKHFGPRLLMESSALIEFDAMVFLDHLNASSDDVYQIESTMRKALKKTDFPELYADQVQDCLIREKTSLSDKDAVTTKLLSYKQVMEQNLTAFTKGLEEKKFLPEDWKQLFAWKDKELFADPVEFAENLQKQTEAIEKLPEQEQKQKVETKQKEQENGQDKKQKTEDKVSWSQYLHESADKQIKTTYVSPGQKLQKDLGNWEGFGGIFETEENRGLLSGALQTVLKDRLLETALPFMKGIDNLKALDNLKQSEYRELCLFLQVNLAKTAVNWSGLRTETALEIKEKLLPRMLSGELKSAKAFDAAMEQENQSADLQKKTQKQRAAYLLGTNQEEKGRMQYRYLLVGTKKKGQIEKRVRHFANAGIVWKDLYGQNDPDMIRSVLELNQWLLNQYQGEETDGPLDVYLWHHIRGVQGNIDRKHKLGEKMKNSGISGTSKQYENYANAAARLEQSFNKIWAKSKDNTAAEPEKIRREAYMEFLMCGMGEALYQPGATYEKEFTGDETTYRQSLHEKSRIMVDRSLFVEKLLGKLCDPVKEKEQIPKLRSRLHMIVGGMEPLQGENLTRAMRKENRRRYGVESLQELEQVLREYASEGEILAVLENNDTVQWASKRKDQMEAYNKGVFAGLVSELMQQDEVWNHIMQDKDQAFEEYLKSLSERLAPLTQILNGVMFRENAGSRAAFLNEYRTELLKEHEETDYWPGRISDFTNALLEKRAGGKTLEKRLKKADKKYGPVLSMLILTAVINDDPDAYQSLYDEEAMETMLRRGARNYEANQKYMKKILEERKERQAFVAPFTQYMTNRSILMPEKEFQAQFDTWLLEYRSDMRKQSAIIDNSHLIRLEKNRVQVSEKVLDGIEAEKAQQEQLKALRAQLYRVKSPVLAKAGRTDEVTETEWKHAKGFVAEHWQDAPESIQERMVEELLTLQLTGLSWKSKVEEQLPQLQEKAELLKEQYQKLKEEQKKNPALAGLQLDRYLLFLSLQEKAGRADDPADQAARFAQFQARQANVQTILDLKKLSAFAFLRQEMQDTADCLNMGLYTMDDQAFQELYESRKRYFESAELACQVIEKQTEQIKQEHGYEWSSSQMQAGLRDYFRKEILEGVKDYGVQTFEEQVHTCLLNEQMHRALLDYHTELGSVSSDSAMLSEQSTVMATRETLETRLAECNAKKKLKQYNALTRQQRELFALALTVPGQFHVSEKLRGSQLLARETESDPLTERKLEEQFQNFVEHREFQPDVAYEKAIGRLFDADGMLDEEVFEQAMAFTQACIAQYQLNEPKDWDRMNQGEESVKRAMLALKTKRPEQCAQIEKYMESQIEGPEQFMAVLEELAVQDEKEKLLERFKKLSEGDVKLLISILQRRTALDRTTGEAEQLLEYADPEARAELMEQLLGEEVEECLRHAAGSEGATQALHSLLSFQLRDDVNLTGRFLEEKDFADGALKRKTVVDWTLFERAMKVLHNVNSRKSRILALRQTTSLIEQSGNEKAIRVYRDYKDKQSLTQSEFDEFLKQQAVADQEQEQVPALMAGYAVLNENQKRLFMRALQNRDILDVSKARFYSSYIGLTERDYVNPQERDSLANEYLRNIESDQNAISLPEGYEKSALLSLLSRQLDDAVDYGNKKLRLKDQMHGFFRRNRTTAVDWKLFSRALQFVNRTTTEAQILLGDRELYVSRGDLKENGTFRFHGEYLRKNLHSAGNRATRVVGRMLKEKIQSTIPLYSTFQKYLAKFSDRVAEKIDTYGLGMEKSESSGGGIYKTLTGINGTVGMIAGQLSNKKNIERMNYILPRNVTTEIKEYAESVNNVTGMIGTVTDVFDSLEALASSVSGVLKLNDAKREAEQKAQFDEKEKKEAARQQTKKQQERGDDAEKRNVRGVESAQFSARQNQYREAFDSLKDIAVSLSAQFTEDLDFYMSIAQTAVECAYCIQQFFVDRTVVKQYFGLKDTMQKNPKLKKLRDALGNSGLKKNGKTASDQYDDVDLFQTAMGFESFDELAAQAGFEMVRTLLFSAGPYNPVRKNRICATMILHVLGFGELIGRQDSEAAFAIYEKLAGTDYK